MKEDEQKKIKTGVVCVCLMAATTLFWAGVIGLYLYFQ